MNATSIRLPDLNRLLLDADVTPEVESILQAVGFRTEHFLRLDVHARDDITVLLTARRLRRILVCFDRHSDRRTRVNWNAEIGLRGGRVIEISEGPEQDAYRAVGKVLISRAEWLAFFTEKKHGVAVVRDGGWRPLDQAALLRAAPKPKVLDADLDPSVIIRGRKPTTQRRRRRGPQQQTAGRPLI